MGFKALEPDDLVVSSDASTAAAWSNNTPTLSTYFSSSTQENSTQGDFFLSVYQTASTDSTAAVQFNIAYGDEVGSGSLFYNSAVTGKSPTRSIYGQYRTLVLGDENAQFVFGGVTSSYFYALSVERARYKESLLPGTTTLGLSGSGGVITLTDDSVVKPTKVFNDAGRVYQLVSGSAGTVYTGLNSNGYTTDSGSYGFFLPDIGTLILNGEALDAAASNGTVGGGIALNTGRSSNTDDNNNRKLFTALSGSGHEGTGWTLNSNETLSSDFVFVRARNSEFNYSANPSFISGSTGEVIYNLFIEQPQTFITTIGLYNDNQELLAVAKLSRPLLKDFTKELLVRAKLDF